MKGLVHVYTGNGKGKTTAAIGLGIRACGRGLKVLMVQFLKSMDTGEIYSLKRLEPNFMYYRGSKTRKFTWQMDEEEKKETLKEQNEIFSFALAESLSGKWDVLILDEILGALSSGFIALKEVVDLISSKPENLEVVLTGRNAPPELIAMADYVSEIISIKHPIEKGIPARKGIEN